MSNVDLPTDLAPWDGWCLELVDSLLHQHPTGDILYVEPRPGSRMWRRWKYHAALVLDGIVYDAWHPEVRLPPAESSSAPGLSSHDVPAPNTTSTMNSDTHIEPSVIDCHHCNRTGLEGFDDEPCVYCDGSGEVDSHEEVCNVCDSGVERCLHCGGQQCACTGCGPECER